MIARNSNTMVSGTASHEEMMMRYKRPRPVAPSAKKTLCMSNACYPGYAFPVSDAIFNDPASTMVSSKNTIPPSVPHRVVLGFNIAGATDNSPSDFDIAESPRSVLDNSVLRSSIFRSPQSSLGSSLSRRLDSHPRVTSSVHSPIRENVNPQDEKGCHHQAAQNHQDFRIQPMQICTSTNSTTQKQYQETVVITKERKPIFFTGSPVDYPGMLSKDFLSHCCFCQSSLQGKDIFMYRGDQAFCSAECRYQKIVIDESKERETVTGTAAAYFPPAATVRRHKF